MKKKVIIGIASILLVISGCLFAMFNSGNRSYEVITNETEERKMNTNALTMMYETEAGSGEYTESSDNTWPLEGYGFNEELSRCENGSKLSWDNTTKRVIVEANTVEKCYVYFDKVQTLAEYITTQVYTGVDGENGLYYHDGQGMYTNADQEAGDNSYRFSGANPNNYVCFGSDVTPCPDDNLYRIIGVFNNEVKLIKNKSIGNYAWDTNNNGWETSYVNPEILNGSYFESINSIWQNMINKNHMWDANGAVQTDSYTVKQYYSSVETYSMAIGLMYISDYGYAADPVYWTTAMLQYSNTRANNWMYYGEYEWTMTETLQHSDGAFYADGFDPVDDGGKILTYAVRPTFYLNSNVIYVNGTGTQTDSYQIAV